MFPTTPLAERLRVALNQAYLRKVAGTVPRLLLAPRPPTGCGGSVAHYYHFVFDLMMPLSRLFPAGRPPMTFQLRSFGPLTGAIRDVFGEAIEILPESGPASTERCATLLGMNPRCVRSICRDLEDFRRFVLGRFSVNDVREPDTVVLIERMPPDPYFLQFAEGGGAGASRRSLMNHQALQEWLSGAVRSPYRFLNLRLETMPLREQVETFSRTALVMGQHGAGLANIAWMARGQVIVELDDMVRPHFALIARSRRCDYLRYRLAAPHAVVDVPGFRDWLGRQPALRNFFN